MNVFAKEEQKRPSFGLHAFLNKIPSPRRKQRNVATRNNQGDDDESTKGYDCPYVSSHSKLQMSTPHKQSSRISTSDQSVSSSASSKSSRLRKASLRSLFQRQLTKSKETDDDVRDDKVSLLLNSLPLEQEFSTDASLVSSDWSDSWRINNDSFHSVNDSFYTSQSSIDPDISLLFFTSSEQMKEEDNVPIVETSQSRRCKKSMRTHLQLEIVPCDDPETTHQKERKPQRRTPESPRRRRQTRRTTRTRLLVRHAFSA